MSHVALARGLTNAAVLEYLASDAAFVRKRMLHAHSHSLSTTVTCTLSAGVGAEGG